MARGKTEKGAEANQRRLAARQAGESLAGEGSPVFVNWLFDASAGVNDARWGQAAEALGQALARRGWADADEALWGRFMERARRLESGAERFLEPHFLCKAAASGWQADDERGASWEAARKAAGWLDRRLGEARAAWEEREARRVEGKPKAKAKPFPTEEWASMAAWGASRGTPEQVGALCEASEAAGAALAAGAARELLDWPGARVDAQDRAARFERTLAAARAQAKRLGSEGLRSMMDSARWAARGSRSQDDESARRLIGALCAEGFPWTGLGPRAAQKGRGGLGAGESPLTTAWDARASELLDQAKGQLGEEAFWRASRADVLAGCQGADLGWTAAELARLGAPAALCREALRVGSAEARSSEGAARIEAAFGALGERARLGEIEGGAWAFPGFSLPMSDSAWRRDTVEELLAAPKAKGARDWDKSRLVLGALGSSGRGSEKAGQAAALLTLMGALGDFGVPVPWAAQEIEAAKLSGEVGAALETWQLRLALREARLAGAKAQAAPAREAGKGLRL